MVEQRNNQADGNLVRQVLAPQTIAALVDDIKSSEEIASMDLPEPADFINQGYKISIIGEMQSGKSCLAIQIGMDLAIGRNILGYFENERQWRVLYVNYELPEEEVDVRINLFETSDKFFRVTLPQRGLESQEGYQQVAYRLESMEQRGQPIDVLILDNKTNCMEGDENQTQDQRAWNTKVDQLIAEHNNLAVIIVHHYGRSKRPGGRGSSAFGGWLTKRLELQDGVLKVIGKVGEARNLSLDFQYPQWKVSDQALRDLEDKTEIAKNLIRRELYGGDKPRKELEIQAHKDLQISSSTFKRALRQL